MALLTFSNKGPFLAAICLSLGGMILKHISVSNCKYFSKIERKFPKSLNRQRWHSLGLTIHFSRK